MAIDQLREFHFGTRLHHNMWANAQHRIGEGEPARDVERVDRRVVDDHLGDPIVLLDHVDGHGAPDSPRSWP